MQRHRLLSAVLSLMFLLVSCASTQCQAACHMAAAQGGCHDAAAVKVVHADACTRMTHEGAVSHPVALIAQPCMAHSFCKDTPAARIAELRAGRTPMVACDYGDQLRHRVMDRDGGRACLRLASRHPEPPRLRSPLLRV